MPGVAGLSGVCRIPGMLQVWQLGVMCVKLLDGGFRMSCYPARWWRAGDDIEEDEEQEERMEVDEAGPSKAMASQGSKGKARSCALAGCPLAAYLRRVHGRYGIIPYV